MSNPGVAVATRSRLNRVWTMFVSLVRRSPQDLTVCVWCGKALASQEGEPPRPRLCLDCEWDQAIK